MIRLLCFALLGAVVAGGVAWIVSADEAWAGLVIPCFITLSVLTPIVLAVRGVAGAGLGALAGPPNADELAAAEAQGRLALARVKAISRTGTMINDQPVCDLDLVVVPRFGRPFEVRTRRIVDLVEIPRLQPEGVVVVLMREQAPSPVTIVMDPPDDWVLLAQSDERVRTTRSADPFVPAPEAGKDARTGLRRIPAPLYLVAALAGAALALIPAYPTIAALATGGTTLGEVRHASSEEGRAESDAEAEAAAGMFVGENARVAVDVLIEGLDSNDVTQLVFWAANLSATAPSAPGAGTLDGYHVIDGEFENTGPAGSQPDPGALELMLFDATAVDTGRFPELIAEAQRLSGLDELDPEQDQWVYVSRSGSSETGAPPVVVDVPVYGEYYDAWVTFSLEGEVLSMRGGAPGSASYEAENGAG
ncbi:hypothetical protein [Agromyces sp. NPDC058064]|uniref:hypothetical protein n=1 Tax=Agromyces sp. NPDC058064 TaxID=3346322 RepID=UPI0036DAFFED